MAKARVEGFDDLEKLFRDLSDADAIAIEAVDKAVPVLEKSLKSAIQGAAIKGYASGELAASIEHKPAKKNQYGVFSVVLPVGTDSKGVSNAKKAAILEFGRRGGYPDSNGRTVSQQEPRPYRQSAIDEAKSECEEIMRESVYKRIDGM